MLLPPFARLLGLIQVAVRGHDPNPIKLDLGLIPGDERDDSFGGRPARPRWRPRRRLAAPPQGWAPFGRRGRRSRAPRRGAAARKSKTQHYRRAEVTLAGRTSHSYRRPVGVEIGAAVNPCIGAPLTPVAGEELTKVQYVIMWNGPCLLRVILPSRFTLSVCPVSS
jgi:hypothetical protein